MFTDFLQELQKELQFHLNGGTSYRQRTAQISLDLARQVGEISPFLKLDTAQATVSRLLPTLDHDRVEDVAKMLYVIAKDMQMYATRSDDVIAYVQQKRQHSKPLSFKKK
ncbi:hypothetical protein JQN58_01510 [Aneurinibacillus sp. BA2021]|nr:hypothetical protein [Aneurinibacillus sp. BA2021]